MSTIPQSQVFAEFAGIPPEVTDPMRPHLLGPQAKLLRYAQTSEKLLGLLGSYDPSQDVVFPWPNLPSLASVDLSYAQVYIDNALLLYFSDLTGAGSTIAPVAPYKDRVRSNSVAFKSNGTTYPRNAALLDRDVQVGDVAVLTGVVGGVPTTLTTYVKGFVGELGAATVGAAAASSSNKAAQGAGSSVDQIAGSVNCVTPVFDSGIADYDGRADGAIDETYVVTVQTGSVGGDYATAILNVTSSSGLDDVASVSPDAAGNFAIGSRGLNAQFELTPGPSCTDLATSEGVSAVDLVAGQSWRFHVVQVFTPAVAASSGSYTGTQNATYIVKVLTGGPFSAHPTIICTTDIGVDAGGAVAVTASGAAVAVGSLGILIAFTGTGLRAGDQWTIVATASTRNAMQTLILGQPLPTLMLSATDLSLKLYIKKNLVLPVDRTDSPPDLNWSADATAGVTVKGSATAFDSTWTDSGVQQVLPVEGGSVYVQARYWLHDWVGKIGSLSNPTTSNPTALVAALLGTVHPDNPLAYGVWQALFNSGGQTVRFSGTSPGDGQAGWQSALDYLAFRSGPYNIVPLSFDLDVQAAVVTHVTNQSAQHAGTFRSCFLGLQATETAAIFGDSIGSTDGNPILATLADDPDTAGTQYTYLSVTSDNAQFVSGLTPARVGDTVRYLFGADAFGTASWTEFQVAEVVNEHVLRLATANAIAVTTPVKVEVWRNYTSAEIETNVKAHAASLDSTRICCVWPDSFTDSNGLTLVPGYFLAAAAAGLRGGAAPHRSLRGVAMSGVGAVPRTTEFFTAALVRDLGTNRIWTFGEDSDGTVYIQHAVTTGDPASVNTREEAVRNDLDAVQIYFFTALRPFMDSNNVYPSSLDRLHVQVQSVIEFLKSTGQSDELGTMLISATIATLRMSLISVDQVVLQLSPVVLPFPYSEDVDLTITLS